MSTKPLEGIRVLDFTWSVNGPTITRIMAALGAEIIKVEWPAHPDPMRSSMYKKDEQNPNLDNSPFFANMNVGKKSFTVNVKSEKGLTIIKDLMRTCDVVAESYSSNVFESWGFSYEKLNEIRPGIVYISCSGFGHTGRYSNYDTWGPTAQSFNGMTFLSGLPGETPAGWGWSLMDVAGGYAATFAVLTALLHQKKTGEGQYIDFTQVESGIPLTGPAILDFQANGRKSRREGYPTGNRAVWPTKEEYVNANRGEIGAPYNIYPTKGQGYNDYCVISVKTDKQWNQLKKVMNYPSWADDVKFKTLSNRIKNQDELDDYVKEWTIKHEKYELMNLLQNNGIPSGALQSGEDLLENDPQLKYRELFDKINHPLVGNYRFEKVPFKMKRSTVKLEEKFPILGADNEYVLKDILDYSNEEINKLELEGVTWPKGMSKNVTVDKSMW